jgi:tetratricopeptide (TPR) repeat protein
MPRLESVVEMTERIRETRVREPSTVLSRVGALSHGSLQLLLLGRYEAAELLVREALKDIRDFECDEPVARARVESAQAFLALVRDDLEGALEHFGGSVEFLEQVGAVRTLVLSRSHLGLALLELGLVKRAEEVLETALAQAEQMSLKFGTRVARVYLGYSRARRGALDARFSQEGVAYSGVETGDRRVEGSLRMFVGEMLGAMGDLNAAESHARAAVDEVKEFPPVHARALASLATVSLRQRKAELAYQAAEEGMEILENLGGLLVGESDLRLAWALALDAVGLRPQAREALGRAHQRLLERAGRISNRQWRSAFLSVPENARTAALANEWGLATATTDVIRHSIS